MHIFVGVRAFQGFFSRDELFSGVIVFSKLFLLKIFMNSRVSLVTYCFKGFKIFRQATVEFLFFFNFLGIFYAYELFILQKSWSFKNSFFLTCLIMHI